MASLAEQRVPRPREGTAGLRLQGGGHLCGRGAQLAQNVAPDTEAPAQGLSLQAWLHAWHKRVASGEAGAQKSCFFQRI